MQSNFWMCILVANKRRSIEKHFEWILQVDVLFDFYWLLTGAGSVQTTFNKENVDTKFLQNKWAVQTAFNFSESSAHKIAKEFFKQFFALNICFNPT
jgi:hypothetical protein